MNKRSLTINGLIIAGIGLVLTKLGIPVVEGALETTIVTIIQIAGGLIAYYGRLRQKDVSVIGTKIKK